MADVPALERLLTLRLPLVANRLTRMMARACRSFGLSAPGWRIVVLLGQRGAMPLREIIVACGLDKVRLSRVTRQLLAQGYLEQRSVVDDRRQVMVELTPRGKEVCRDLMRVMLDLQATLLGSIGDEEYKIFERVLGRLESQAKAAASSARDTTEGTPHGSGSQIGVTSRASWRGDG